MRLHYHNLHSLLVNRHWLIIKRYLTVRKLANVLNCLVYYWMRRDIVASRPLYVKVETTDCCNLRCEHCHDGTVERRNEFLDFSMYASVIDQYSCYLLEVSLFDQGEPLLDPLIVDYIRYASSRNIGTVISTNLSMTLSDEQLSQLVTSGLDYIQVAIDGVTQATYAISTWDDVDVSCGPFDEECSTAASGLRFVGSVAIFGMPGMLIGGVVGAISPGERWQSVNLPGSIGISFDDNGALSVQFSFAF